MQGKTMRDDKDPMGTKFKELERKERSKIDDSKFTVLRMDGRAFHTYTKNFERPFDSRLATAMDDATIALMKNTFPKNICGYTQSDEISLVIPPVKEPETLPFDGRVDKVLSLASSTATLGFVTSLIEKTDMEPSVILGVNSAGFPLFDARFFQVDTIEEVMEYMNWRRLDARKNAISSTAMRHFSKKDLHGKPTSERLQMLQEIGKHEIDLGTLFGRVFVREARETEVSYVDKRTGEMNTTLAMRTFIDPQDATLDVVEEILGVN